MKKLQDKKNKQKGFGLLEVVISASILTILIVTVVVVFQTIISHSNSTIRITQASFLAEEGIEAVKSLRDQDWDTKISVLNVGAPYFLDFQFGSSLWEASLSESYVDYFFYRYFTIEDVERDGSGVIVESGGTVDPNIKKVTVNVDWFSKNATSTRSLSTYITNIHEN